MKIFSDEFKDFIKSKTIRRLKGHKSSDWMEEQWAPAHGTGYQVKSCLRCHKELNRRPPGNLYKIEVLNEDR